MSWSRTSQGSAEQVCTEIADAIRQSASYDETLAAKAAGVAEATKHVIEAAAIGVPEGKELYVSSWGHLDHAGMSSYGVQVAFVDVAPVAVDDASAGEPVTL